MVRTSFRRSIKLSINTFVGIVYITYFYLRLMLECTCVDFLIEIRNKYVRNIYRL